MSPEERFGPHHRMQVFEHRWKSLPDPQAKGRFYSWWMEYNGEVIVAKSRHPELEACRVLRDRGLTGKAIMYRGDMPCLIIPDLVAYANRNERASRLDEPEEPDSQG